MLAFLKEEPGNVELCQEVIGEASKGEVLIVTSTLSIAEVLWVKGKEKIPEKDRQLVRDFFRHEWIFVHEVDRKIAHSAQDVVWDYNVRPKDAVHVATAMAVEADCLDTFDDGLLNHSGQIGDPGLLVCKPGAADTLFKGALES